MKKQLFLLSTVALFLASCSTQQPISTNSDTNAHHPSENAVLWQQTAAEYDALCYQAYNIAKLRIEQYGSRAIQTGDMPAAIIMDIDETILDNSAYNARLVLENKKHTEERWNDWVKESKAELIPGAMDFIQFVQETIDIPIFFISNRSEGTLSYTIDNLQMLGVEVEVDQILLKTESSNKAQRRNQILNEYNVIMYIGDNLADFENIFEEQVSVSERNETVKDLQPFMGSKFIILPNPMYGDWYNTLKYDDSQGEYNTTDFNDNRRHLKTDD